MVNGLGLRDGMFIEVMKLRGSEVKINYSMQICVVIRGNSWINS